MSHKTSMFCRPDDDQFEGTATTTTLHQQYVALKLYDFLDTVYPLVCVVLLVIESTVDLLRASEKTRPNQFLARVPPYSGFWGFLGTVEVFSNRAVPCRAADAFLYC